MRYLFVILLLATSVAGLPAVASAQSSGAEYPVSSRVQITLYPAGALYATEGKDPGQPSFGAYSPTAAIGVQLGRFVALEGEIGGGVGIDQKLDYTGGTLGTLKPPSMLNYTGNLIVNLWRPESRVVPYVAGGAGAITLFNEPGVGVSETKNYFSANVGAGLKVMFNRWGFRGDYRFIAIDPGNASDTPPSFLGGNTRYAHRATVGLVIPLGPSMRAIP